MSAGQHLREGSRHRFWLGAGPEPPPKNNLWLLQSGRRDGAGRPPASPAVADGVFDNIAAVGFAVDVGGAAAFGPSWNLGARWRCLGSSRWNLGARRWCLGSGRQRQVTGTTPSRRLLLGAGFTGGSDLGSRGGGGPDKQRMC
jgi:hypothetical protein